MNPRRGRRWGLDPGADQRSGTPRRSLVVALVLASVSLMVLDQGAGGTAVDPARQAVGEVLGPAESGAAAAARPLVRLPQVFDTRGDLREEVATLQAENAELRRDVHRSGYDRNRLAELEGLTAAARDLGMALVPARVVGLGSSQSFSQTVTIDAGSDAGVAPDLTVVNNDGLVGRVLRVTRSTATVLLVVDPDSTVGGRVGTSMELGFLHGRGGLGHDARLDLELVDQTVVPARDDAVVTWGSEGAGPYVPGVPVGRVTTVWSSLRDSSQRVEIAPFVDFSALDVVGVVVPSGATSDRAVIEADGSLR